MYHYLLDLDTDLTSGNGSRATCYLQTLKYKQAISDFKKVLNLEPQNDVVRQQMESTQKILRKSEFEKVQYSDIVRLV